MSQGSDFSPDEPLDTEVFEQGDEALDEGSRTDPDFLEAVEQDPSVDPTLQVDEQELEEADAELDDPESLATLDGGMDDPDGVGAASGGGSRVRDEDSGWNLDAPLVRETGDGADDDAG